MNLNAKSKLTFAQKIVCYVGGALIAILIGLAVTMFFGGNDSSKELGCLLVALALIIAAVPGFYELDRR